MSIATIETSLQSAIKQFATAKTYTPKLDAEVLLAHVLNVERVDLYIQRDRNLTDDESDNFSNVVKRRIKKEPIAYIIGSKEFWSINISVNPNVLIPRPETELIIEQALKIFKDKKIAFKNHPSTPLMSFPRKRESRVCNYLSDRDPRLRGDDIESGDDIQLFDILDICTGSGCIATALASEFPNAQIVATDISKAALDVAKKNLAFAENRTQFLLGDLFDSLITCPPCKPARPARLRRSRGGRARRGRRANHESLITKKFDLITANPPYVADQDFETLADDIRHYEPSLALLAGTDGLAISKRIINDAPKYLKPDGLLIIEMGMGQARALQKHAKKNGHYKTIQVVKDYSGIERVLIAKHYPPPL